MGENGACAGAVAEPRVVPRIECSDAKREAFAQHIFSLDGALGFKAARSSKPSVVLVDAGRHDRPRWSAGAQTREPREG
jgi:hypothetical protein